MRNKIDSYVLSKKAGDLGIGIDHFKRVYRIAQEIADKDYDDDALFASSLLHDISDKEPHEKFSALESIQFLRKNGFPEDKIATVADAISNHNPEGNPQTYEGQLIHDADKLDKLGAIGTVRYAASLKNRFHENDLSTLIKILNKVVIENSKVFILPSAKTKAKQKIKISKNIIKQLEKENL